MTRVWYMPRKGGRKRPATVLSIGVHRVKILTDDGDTIEALPSKLKEMTMPTKINYFAKFEEFARTMPRAELGGLIKEYLAEANHGGWDGFEARDKRGISKLLCDLIAYHENSPEPRDFATGISNVNPVP